MSVLGLIAGSGPLPFEVVRAARRHDLDVVIAAIESNTDPEIAELAPGPFDWFNAGELGRLIDFLKQHAVRELILAGAVSKRRVLQDPGALRPDARALALVGSLAKRGDDALLRALADEFASEGMTVVDSTRYLGDRLTAVGSLCGAAPAPAQLADLELGMQVIASLGGRDVGQAVLVKDGTVLAIEAVEGTDEMVRRGARFGRGAVLAKAAKPGQDMRFDVPVIGPATIELAAECGLAAIGLEAGRTLVLEPEEAYAAAEKAGIPILGMRLEA